MFRYISLTKDLAVSSEGQERRYIKAKEQSVAKNAVPACVVSPSFLAKGNREEREVV